MNQQTEEHAVKEKQIAPADLNLFIRMPLTLTAAAVAYLIITTHFLFCVRTAHFLGDVTYIPPSILHYTGVIFSQGELGAFIQIVFFVFWLILVVVGCLVMFAVVFFPAAMLTGFLADDDKPLELAIMDCVGNGFLCLLPVLLLSLLTLLIMPLESLHPASESASLTQIGALMPFSEFLFTMSEATIVIFLVCFFVVVTVAVAYLLSFILPDDGFFFLVLIFIGVCVGMATIFVLGHFIYQGIDFIKLKTGDAYLTLYLIFSVYAALCAVFILPSMLRKAKKPTTNSDELKRIKKSKSGNNKMAIAN